MFSAQQLEKFAGKRRITQQTFDQAVRENVEEFDMEEEEAVASAIAEFQAQGVELTNIVTTAKGANEFADHPLSIALNQVNQMLDTQDTGLMSTVLSDLCKELSAAVAQTTQTDNCLIALISSLNVVDTLVRIIISFQPQFQYLESIAKALAAILPLSRDLRSAFRAVNGTAVIDDAINMMINEMHERAEDKGTFMNTLAACFQAIAASTVADEDGKTVAMTLGCGATALHILSLYGATSPSLVIATCSLITSLTTADDETQPSSKAFSNARQLAKESDSAKVLVSILREHSNSNNNAALLSVLTTLRTVSANEDICKQVFSAGGVVLGLQLADGSIQSRNVSITRAALSLLRQLASSDIVKVEFYEAGGLDTIKNALLMTFDVDDGKGSGACLIAEQALGLLTNVTLRNPEVSIAAVNSGCVAEVLHVMRVLMDNDAGLGANSKSNGGKGSRTSAGNALRQGCMAIRNIGARCPDERQGMLAEGAEGIIREAKQRYREACGDVGSAALRDLGLDAYND